MNVKVHLGVLGIPQAPMFALVGTTQLRLEVVTVHTASQLVFGMVRAWIQAMDQADIVEAATAVDTVAATAEEVVVEVMSNVSMATIHRLNVALLKLSRRVVIGEL